eukprot:scaffold624_cov207-Chaetoceros_neogracile.AAC.6
MSEENHTLRSLQHPLDLLDQYLLNLPIPTASKTNNQQIIEISDFLYGKQNNRVSNRVHGSSNSPSPASHPPLGSILEGSLELLDSFDDPSQTLAPIRMIIAKDSGRRAIVVRAHAGGHFQIIDCDMERKEKMGPFERATEVMEEWKSEFRTRSVDELLAYGKQLVQPAM